ncbi:Uncharacterised protein [uncultured archaeon]|nr:Uncharacterised protein [uncultured archaeon]
MTNKITESNIETFAIKVLQKLGWQYIRGLALAPGVKTAREGKS